MNPEPPVSSTVIWCPESRPRLFVSGLQALQRAMLGGRKLSSMPPVAPAGGAADRGRRCDPAPIRRENWCQFAGVVVHSAEAPAGSRVLLFARAGAPRAADRPSQRGGLHRFQEPDGLLRSGAMTD